MAVSLAQDLSSLHLFCYQFSYFSKKITISSVRKIRNCPFDRKMIVCSTLFLFLVHVILKELWKVGSSRTRFVTTSCNNLRRSKFPPPAQCSSSERLKTKSDEHKIKGKSHCCEWRNPLENNRQLRMTWLFNHVIHVTEQLHSIHPLLLLLLLLKLPYWSIERNSQLNQHQFSFCFVKSYEERIGFEVHYRSIQPFDPSYRSHRHEMYRFIHSSHSLNLHGPELCDWWYTQNHLIFVGPPFEHLKHSIP